jgi:DNA repair exonuclease SbcCD ATPase subunit
MIEALSLKNFRQHATFEVEFPSGLTLISGPNYAGKTTLLYAVLFAFGGPSAVPGGAKRIVKRGCKPGTMEVSVRFFHRGAIYALVRGLKDATLHRDGQLEATGLAQVTKAVEDVVGMPGKFFHALKYVPQGNTQALLTLGAGELHKIVDHVSGANLVNAVIARASARANEAEAGLRAIGEAVDLKELNERLSGLKELVDTLTSKEHSIRHAQAGESARHRQLELEFQAALAHNEAVRRSEEALTSVRQRIADLESRTTESRTALDMLRGELERTQGVRAEYEAMAARWAAHEGAAAELRREEEALKRLKDKRADALDRLPDVEYESIDLDALQMKRDAAFARHQSASQRVSDLKRSSETARCHACGRPFEGYDEATLLQGLMQAQDEAAEAGRALTRLDQEFSQSSRLLSLHAVERGLAQQVEEQERRVAEALRRLNAAVCEPADVVESARMRAESWSRKRADYEALHRVDAQDRQRLEAAEAERDRLVAEQAETGSSTVHVQPLLEEVRELGKALQLRAQQLEAVRADLGQARLRFESLASEIARAEATEARRAELLEGKTSSAALAKYLRDNRDRFLSSLWSQVMGFASSFAATCTGGAISEVVRTEDGGFGFVEDGFSDDVITASGAQRSIMALGVQLALDTLLPDTFGALLLDEPTADMDVVHSATLTQALAGTGRQILMVSHRDLDGSSAQMRIEL